MTLFECNTELPSMMDIAKVADQVSDCFCNYLVYLIFYLCINLFYTTHIIFNSKQKRIEQLS